MVNNLWRKLWFLNVKWILSCDPELGLGPVLRSMASRAPPPLLAVYLGQKEKHKMRVRSHTAQKTDWPCLASSWAFENSFFIPLCKTRFILSFSPHPLISPSACLEVNSAAGTFFLCAWWVTLTPLKRDRGKLPLPLAGRCLKTIAFSATLLTWGD